LFGALQIVPQLPKSGVDKNNPLKHEVQLVGEKEQVLQKELTALQSTHISPFK
jgi:hypothetical protein